MALTGGVISEEQYKSATTVRASELAPAVVQAREIKVGQGFHFNRAWLNENIDGVEGMNVEAAQKRASYLAGRITSDAANTKSAKITTKQVNNPETNEFDGFVIFKTKYVAPAANGSNDSNEETEE